MNVKITFFFECVQQATDYASAALGWTETFYGFSNAIPNIDGWLNAADVEAYIKLRRATLPSVYRIAWLRVADEANPRSFKVRALLSQVGTASTPNSGVEGVGQFGQVQCALLADLVRLPDVANDHTHHRKFLMRGLPADVINGNIVNTLAANWRPIIVFLSWLAFTEAGRGGVRLPANIQNNTTIGLRYQNPANLAFLPAAGVINDPGDPRQIKVNDTLAGPVGSAEYLFRRFPDNVRALNRNWKLQAVLGPPASVSLLGKSRRALPEGIDYVPPGPGQYRQVVSVYNLFNEFTIIGLRSKKTGRLFRQLRGRSPNR